MNNFLSTFIERSDQRKVALLEHLQISLISLFIAMLIAIPFAILIANKKKISEVTLQIAGIMQTIPSLALLGLFIPLLSIGKKPAIVTLVIYGIFPILQNTISGLRGIDPVLKEAATAFGMTRFEKLKNYEIPLAMPHIIGGVRTSSVMLIGTATLGALIGAGGLGSFILLGIDRNNPNLILIGAISSALLAIIINALIRFMEDKKIKTIISVFLISFIVLLTSTFSFGKSSSKNFVIAGKLGAEPDILINMYKDLIEKNTDIKVELKPNFGKTAFLFEALKNRKIDIYPEFSGTITSSLLKTKIDGLSNDPKEVYEKAKYAIYDQDKLVFLKPMEYQNTYAIAVKKSFAEENDLKKISDLKKIEDKIKAGFTIEFNDREDGNKGLKSLYDLDFKAVTMEPKLRYTALNQGDINLIEVYSTDSEIITHDLTLPEDDKQLFPPYQGGPLLRKDALEKYPEIKQALEKLSGKISAEEMTQLNYKVDVEGKSAADVAREYLEENDLIK